MLLLDELHRAEEGPQEGDTGASKQGPHDAASWESWSADGSGDDEDPGDEDEGSGGNSRSPEDVYRRNMRRVLSVVWTLNIVSLPLSLVRKK